MNWHEKEAVGEAYRGIVINFLQIIFSEGTFFIIFDSAEILVGIVKLIELFLIGINDDISVLPEQLIDYGEISFVFYLVYELIGTILKEDHVVCYN